MNKWVRLILGVLGWVAFAIVAVVLFTGCIENPFFDIDNYINARCDGTAEAEFQIDDEFDAEQMSVIAYALDDANDDLGTNIQICGHTGYAENYFIEYGWTDSDSQIGYYNPDTKTVIIYPTNWMNGYDHMRKVFLHELGHYFGAEHSTDPKDVMCTGWHGVFDYSRADIKAIKEAM